MFEQYVGTSVEEQVVGDAARLMTHETIHDSASRSRKPGARRAENSSSDSGMSCVIERSAHAGYIVVSNQSRNLGPNGTAIASSLLFLIRIVALTKEGSCLLAHHCQQGERFRPFLHGARFHSAWPIPNRFTGNTG